MDEKDLALRDLAAETPRPRGRPPLPAGSVPDYSGLGKLSPTHEAIMDWVLCNPGATIRECAAVFNYTPGGISYILNSDCFRAKLRERREQIELLIAADIPSKLQVLASLSVERTTEILEKTNDPELIVDIFDKTLHKLGYAPNKGAGVSVMVNTGPQVYTASKEDIAQAQSVLLQAGRQIPMLIPANAASTDSASPASPLNTLLPRQEDE